MLNKHTSRSTSLAWILFSLTLILVFLGLLIFAITRGIDVGPRWGPRYFPVGFAVGFGTMGVLIVTRQPNNRIGRLYSWMGLMAGLQLFLENYAVISVLADYGSLPFGGFSAWVASWIWVPAAAPALTLLPLIFPDGRLMSARWRPFAWMIVL
jgi:hypothetical protein